MAYGEDTEELLRRIAAVQSQMMPSLRISGLRIHSLPPLPENLKELWCYNTQITELPPLPPSLECLCCLLTPLKKLPPLPPSLRFLDCSNTSIDALPELPEGLVHLDVRHMKIKLLPRLPLTLEHLRIDKTPLFIRGQRGDTPTTYAARWNEFWDSMVRQQERCAAVKEDLMAAVWHPRRVEKWLEAGRWDLLD